MTANFTPNMSSITDMKPFRFWCQKVLPTVYDDSLSYYELLNKVVNYLNETVDNVELLNDNVTRIYDAYILLQSYVNNYIDNEMPQLASDKLDEMAEDGTLTALIGNYVDPIFEAKSDELDDIVEQQDATIQNAITQQNSTISNAISQQNSTISDAISQQTTTLNSAISTQNSNITTMESQLTNFLTSQTADANTELLDIRVGADGTIYSSAGNAVRGQATDLKNALLNERDGLQTFIWLGNFQPYGLQADGTFLTSQKYRVSNDDPMTFDFDITVNVSNGFRWGFIPFTDGTAGAYSGWITTPKTITKGTSFVVQIARVTENTSEIANVSEFLNALTFKTKNEIRDENTADTLNKVWQEWVITGNASTSVKTSIPMAQDEKFTYSNNTSGSNTLQLFNGTTLVSTLPNVASGDSYTFVIPSDCDILNVWFASGVQSGETGKLVKHGTYLYDVMVKQKKYYVEKDGSGDYTKLTDAITEACKYMGSVIYVGDGVWDIIAELGSAINDISSTNWGVYLSNRVHIIFSSNSKVVANYTGNNTNVLTYFSPFNTGEYGFTLENATIEASRCRYCVHDERGEETDHYECHYINCNMLMDNSNNEEWSAAQCIGGGLGMSAYIDIDGCVFDSNMWGGIVSYHNCAYANSKSNVNLHNSYFKRHGTFRLCWYGVSTEITTAYVSGCSFASAIVHRAENEGATVENTAVVEWNNIVRS